MECKKCSVNIPQEFEYALVSNICPKCGHKLMNDMAMKVYMDLKKRLSDEVEFIMDKAINCERVATFVINNYEVVPLGTIKIAASVVTDPINKMKANLALLEADETSTDEDIRAEEAARAEEIAIAREMGIDVDDDEEIVTGLIDANKVQRLKKLAMGASGQLGKIKRSDA